MPILFYRLKTVRRLLHREVLRTVGFVLLGFLSLFAFFDLVDELQNLGRPNILDGSAYQVRHALLFVSLLLPSRLYELLPISVLIGTIFVMARLAQSSEYTILRTSGLDPWRALRLLLSLGTVFVALAFVVGDYMAPAADRARNCSRRGTSFASPSVRPAPGYARSRTKPAMWSTSRLSVPTMRCRGSKYSNSGPKAGCSR